MRHEVPLAAFLPPRQAATASPNWRNHMILTRRNLLQLLGISATATILLPHANVPAEPRASVREITRVASEPRTTPLEMFLKSRGIKPAHLARESGYARQHLLQVRFGRIEPSLTCIAAIVVATRRLSGERVDPQDIFDANVIRAAWRDTRDVDDFHRSEIRAAFGRRAAQDFRVVRS